MFILLQKEQKPLKHRYYLRGLERIKTQNLQVLFPISRLTIDLNIIIFSQNKTSNDPRDAPLKSNINPSKVPDLFWQEQKFTTQQRKQLNITTRIHWITGLHPQKFYNLPQVGLKPSLLPKHPGKSQRVFSTLSSADPWGSLALDWLEGGSRSDEIYWETCSAPASLAASSKYMSISLFMVTEFLPKESLIHKSAALIIIDLMILLQCQLNGMKN